jgi:predicted permease
MMIFSNIGYMGMPVVNAIFGKEAEFCVSIFIMVFYIFIYSYGIILITGDGKKGPFQWKRLLTPMMICSVGGIICYLCNVQFGGVVAGTLSSLSAVTTPCAMLIIGCALAALPLKTVFTNWRLYLIAILKLLVIPAITYLCLKPLIPNATILGVIVIIMAMPIASIFTMLSAQYDRDQKLAASSVFLTTLLSVITIPILAGILKG